MLPLMMIPMIIQHSAAHYCNNICLYLCLNRKHALLEKKYPCNSFVIGKIDFPDKSC